MATPGPQKVHRYGAEFKLQAVQMSQQSGVRIKDVAATLGIHPFMLSKWRKQVRDGELVGPPAAVDANTVVELQRLCAVEQQFKRLQQEHELLKKAIRFAFDPKPKFSVLSGQTGTPIPCN
ncbi:MAG: transposase [Burkholderiales bacterium]|jgi:transposase|nr:transposase [Burkholderiales bacterium]